MEPANTYADTWISLWMFAGIEPPEDWDMVEACRKKKLAYAGLLMRWAPL